MKFLHLRNSRSCFGGVTWCPLLARVLSQVPVQDDPRRAWRVPALGSLLVFSPSGVFAVMGADFRTDSLFF